jgi:ligand-binding sensor domain-containing protein
VLISFLPLLAYVPEEVEPYGWNIYTNTTYMHDIECRGDSVIGATWGGVSIFNIQDSSFCTLTTIDGLTKNEVRSVHYINSIDEWWFGCFGTGEGVSRYQNGSFLKPYQENQGVQGSFIKVINDNGEYIFIGCDEGLSMFEIPEDGSPKFKRTFNAPKWLSDNMVNCIAFDDSNRIWIGTNKGIDYTKINYDEMVLPESWYHINSDAPDYPFASDLITDIEYHDNKIFFGTDVGIAYIDISQDDFSFQLISGLPANKRKISALHVSDGSTLWAAFGKWDENFQTYSDAKGVGRYNLQTPEWTFWESDDSPVFWNQISDIASDQYGAIWISTWEDGLYKFQNSTWKHYKPNCINSNLVAQLMFDSEYNLWCSFGTKMPGTTPRGIKGLSKFDGDRWTNYRKRMSNTDQYMWSDRAFRIGEGPHGNIWVGTWGEGFAILHKDEDEWAFFRARNNEWMMGDQVSVIETDENGNVWVAGCSGVGASFETPGGITILFPEAVNALLTGSGNVIIDLPDTSYHQFEMKKKLLDYDHNLYSYMWTMLLYDAQAWFGSYQTGVQYWYGEGYPNHNSPYWNTFDEFPPGGLTSGDCYDLAIQQSAYGDYIFAGTVDGLYMYDVDYDLWYRFASGDIKQYWWDGSEWKPWLPYGYDEEGNPEPRMASGRINQINAIFVDPHGRKWLGTEGGGISVLDTKNYSFTNFNTDNSDLCSNIVLSFAYNPYSGELFAGTSEGLVSFNIGATTKIPAESMPIKEMLVYPNPFRPKEHGYLILESKSNDLPAGKNTLYIYNIAGELVAKLNESDHFRFSWDGTNMAGKPVAGGIYFYVVASEFDEQYLTGKFAVIR